jgi:hypothetical protein
MSATHAEGHDDQQGLHQSSWVYFVTYASCLGFLALVMFAKGLYFSSLAILTATLSSIPATVFLAEKKWFHYVGSVLPFAALMAVGGAYLTAVCIGAATLLSIPVFQVLDSGRWLSSLGLALVASGVVYGLTYLPL